MNNYRQITLWNTGYKIFPKIFYELLQTYMENIVGKYQCGGTQWRSWLRHGATNRKVVGSIPAGVIGIFH